jgi:hypothetical protein
MMRDQRQLVLGKNAEELGIGIDPALRGPELAQHSLEGWAELAIKLLALLAVKPRSHRLREDVGLGETGPRGESLELGGEVIGQIELVTGLSGSHRDLL